MAKWSRPWRGAETQLLGEWLAAKHPNVRTLTGVRVGPIEPLTEDPERDAAELRMLGAWRFWADAVLVFPDHVIIIEAGILPDPGDISRLSLYVELWPQTPDLGDVVTLPARGHLLYGIPNAALESLASRFGLTFESWTPPWIPAYLAERRPGKNRGKA